MKKRALLTVLLFAMVATFVFSLSACNKNVNSTLEKLQNEYGIVVDGGSFEKGTTLISNEILATAEEALEVLEAIADQDYNKESEVHIFDIFAEKDGVKVQPDGKVQVSIPVPNAEVVDYLVFHVKDNGLVEKIIPTISNGKITFETSSFSYFVITEAAPAEHVHSFGEWTAEETVENKHYRECKCGEKETGDCTFDDGVVTQEPTHYEEGVKT